MSKGEAGRRLKIVWVIDASTLETGLQRAAAQVLRAFAVSVNLRVEPVYLLSPAGATFNEKEESSESIGKFRATVERRLNGLFKEVHVPGISKPRIIAQLAPLGGNPVQTLIHHIRTAAADMVLLSADTHGGTRGLISSSFVESLNEYSPAPILLVGPHTAPVASYSEIVFSTDFSESSHAAFQSALEFARKIGSGVVLYWRGDAQTQWIDEESPSANVPERWASEARTLGVRCRTFHDTDGTRELSDSLLDYVTDAASRIIAVSSHEERYAAPMNSGIVARKVVENSACPVWTFHRTETVQEVPEVQRRRISAGEARPVRQSGV